jgi:hypothetical protein
MVALVVMIFAGLTVGSAANAIGLPMYMVALFGAAASYGAAKLTLYLTGYN